MSSWNKLTLKFDPLAPLKPPLKSVLTILQTIEAVLEALVALVKALAIFISNPLTAIISLLLAAIRLIINQLRATGFSILPVIPDFARGDFAQILGSVTGAYPGFERKVIFKMRDTGDTFRPTYPDGSTVFLLIFYIGVDSPGDLLGSILALLAFLNAPAPKNIIPAPIGLKVLPVSKSDDPYSVLVDVGEKAASAVVSVFKDVGKAEYVPALLLEWKMPASPGALNAPGFLNPAISFYNSFRFPKFIVERSELQTGKQISIKLDNANINAGVQATKRRYGMQKGTSTGILREADQITPFRYFETKYLVPTSRGITGMFSGVYRYKDDEIEIGKTYYYRVRAVFGEPTTYVEAKESDFNEKNTDLVKIGNKPFVYYGDKITVGPASGVTRATVPIKVGDWNPYEDLFYATLMGVLLNFDLPAASNSDDVNTKELKTGWGSLSLIAGMIAPHKAVLKESNKLKESKLVRAAIRRLVNQVLTNIITNASINRDLYTQWVPIAAKVRETLDADMVWTFPVYTIGDMSGGLSSSTLSTFNSYLAAEANYVDGEYYLEGPFPTKTWSGNGVTNYSMADKLLLSSFLSSAYAGLGVSSGYLHWYSITLGDLFPAFIPFIYDIEQFIAAVLKALKNIIQEIINIIETIISKIRQLEQIIKAIIALIDLLRINISVAVLSSFSTNGGVETLIDTLKQSENKPGDSPYGLHSGLVITAGGPGEGIINIVKALAFVLGIKLGD